MRTALVPYETSHGSFGYPQAAQYEDAFGVAYGEDEEDQLNFSKWWRAVRKRKWLILTLVFLVTGVATLRMYQIKATYNASAVVEVGKEDTTLVKYGDHGDLLVQTDETLKTKMFILQNAPLLEDVVVGLKLDQNPEFLRDFDPSKPSGEYTKKPVLKAIRDIGARLLFQTIEVPSELNSITPLPTLAENERTRSPAESQRLQPLVGLIQQHLTVEAVPDTRLLRISFTHTNPAISAFVSNGIATTFIERTFKAKNEKFDKTSDWQQKMAKDLKQRVVTAEEAFANYARDHKVFLVSGDKTGPGQSLSAEKVARLNEEVVRAETDRTVKESLYQEVKQGRTAQIPQAFTDPKTVELQKKLGELALKAAELEVTYGHENPLVIEVHEQIAAIQRQIEKNWGVIEAKIKADYERAVRDERSVRAALDQAKAGASQENQDVIHYSILQQEVDTAESFYKDFMQKTSQSTFELSQQSNNLRLVEPAQVPKDTNGPQRFLWILLSLGLSLAGGVGLAILLDRFDPAIKNSEDVDRYLQLPVLGIIPAIGAPTLRLLTTWKNHKRKLLSDDSARGQSNGGRIQFEPERLTKLEDDSPAAEAYRLLRTSVLLSARASWSKILLITSSRPREGKTTTCINTAISLAKLGRSVLLIDCDLRCPAVSSAFGLDELDGISTYLSNSVGIEKVIHETGIPNLSVLPCGPVPANPTELISSGKMKEMLEMLAGRYDRILIDSPPLINLADALILSGLADGVILVVRGGKSDRNVMRRACLELSNVGANILGVVLNDVDSDSGAYSYYRSYYPRYAQAAARWLRIA